MNIMMTLFEQDYITELYGQEQRKEGRKERMELTAINLLNINMDISIIEKATGLSKAEILKLQKSK